VLAPLSEQAYNCCAMRLRCIHKPSFVALPMVHAFALISIACRARTVCVGLPCMRACMQSCVLPRFYMRSAPQCQPANGCHQLAAFLSLLNRDVPDERHS
jgi:hypothetical protein